MQLHFIKGIFHLQVTMTYLKSKKRGKGLVKSVVSTILIFLFAIVSSVILVSEKRKLRAFDERVFYFVSAGSSRKISLLDDKKELLKNLGGANVVYEHRHLSHLLASVYLKQEFADEIKGNLLGHFPESDILKIKSKRVSTSGIRKIKEITGAEEFVKLIYKISVKFQDLQMSYLSGVLSESDFLSEMVGFRINLEKALENIDNSNDLANKIIENGGIFVFQLTNFLNGFTIAKHKQNYVCNYFVEFYLRYVELFDCL